IPSGPGEGDAGDAGQPPPSNDAKDGGADHDAGSALPEAGPDVDAATGFAWGLGETSNPADMRRDATPLAVVAPAPASLDYRSYNGKIVATDAKDQRHCASGWAFAAVGVYESKSILSFGTPPDLSEQQLVEMDGRQHGCHGGSAEALTFWTLAGPGPLDEA